MSTIVACPSCGTRNRLEPQPEGTPRCARCHTALPWVVEADGESFDAEITASVPVLIDFWAPWCGPCRMVTPLVERIGQDNAGRIKVVKLNTDDWPQIAGRYQVQGIPLLVLVENGQEVSRQVGALPEPRLREWLEPHLAAAASS